MTSKQNILIIGAICVMALFIVKSFFEGVSEHGTTESITKSINDLKSNNVLSNIGLKKNSENINDIVKIQEVINNSKEFEDIEISHSDVELKEKRINEIYGMEQKEMSLYLDEVKENQKIIKKWKSEHGIRVSALERMKPEFALTLSTLLNKTVEEAVESDRTELGFSSKDWYFIKTFSESGDLKKLLSQGKLDQEYVNIENLSLVYSNNQPIVHKEDGTVDGLPVAEEDLEDSFDPDDNGID